MEGVLVGCGQITWPRDVPREQVLAEVAQAGYDGVPVNLGGDSPEEVASLYARYGLKCAPGYLSGDFWDPAQHDELVAVARRLAHFSGQVGCRELFVAPSFGWVTPAGHARQALAGRVSPQDGLSEAQYRQFASTLNCVGEETLKEGVLTCFHNHVGSVIETRAEIDHLFSLVDRSLVFLGPDTGHLAWAGADVIQFCLDYAWSIKAMHLKDIDPRVLQWGRTAKWDYAAFSERGIFTELGQGMVDFETIARILPRVQFHGWLVVETDVTQRPTALESALASRQYLQSLGI